MTGLVGVGPVSRVHEVTDLAVDAVGPFEKSSCLEEPAVLGGESGQGVESRQLGLRVAGFAGFLRDGAQPVAGIGLTSARDRGEKDLGQ